MKTQKAVKIVSSALLGLDFRTVTVGGKRYVIHPPTIARIAGAGMHLAEVSEAKTVADLLASQESMANVACALSQFITGTDELCGELSQGTFAEVVEALSEAYSLIDVRDFMKLSTLGRNVARLIANPKQ